MDKLLKIGSGHNTEVEQDIILYVLFCKTILNDIRKIIYFSQKCVDGYKGGRPYVPYSRLSGYIISCVVDFHLFGLPHKHCFEAQICKVALYLQTFFFFLFSVVG